LKPTKAPDFIVSTDLDGTLLDHFNYEWKAAVPAIKFLQSQDIPIIFNTSKTLAEVLSLQLLIGVSGPAIIENGSALALPTRFESALLPSIDTGRLKRKDDHILVNFGRDRKEILKFINIQKQEYGNILEGYDNWTLATVAAKTGLTIDEARLSADKHFSEPFIWLSDERLFKNFCDNAALADLKVLQGGRFFHLQGNTDKAQALQWLQKSLYGKNTSKLPRLICLGDNKNDIHMLNIADYPVCIRSPNSDYPTINENPNTILTKKYGAEGWNEAIQLIFQNYRSHKQSR